MGRYDPLTRLLVEQTADIVEFTFADLDDVVGGLPASARRHREWWANSASPQGGAWLTAGYRVDQVNVSAETVRFVAGSPQPRSRSPRGRIEAASGDTVRPAESPSRVEVHLQWQRVGAVVLGAAGALQFPRVEPRPAVYRLTLFEGAQVDQVYLGESNNLSRRLRNYMKPGPTQATSLRISALVTGHVQRGDVTLDVAGGLRFSVDGRDIDVDLSRKADRVLIEHAALVETVSAGHCVANL
ncbi:MAG: hypothetical protein JJT89_04880 [Nitriliruptoraceae bacterium]|nr:hypothetical protein [Nitriliruptoraceae bacterium]